MSIRREYLRRGGREHGGPVQRRAVVSPDWVLQGREYWAGAEKPQTRANRPPLGHRPTTTARGASSVEIVMPCTGAPRGPRVYANTATRGIGVRTAVMVG